MVVINTSAEDAACAVEESIHQPPKDSSLSRFIDNIINQKPESEDSTIQPLKSSSMSSNAAKKMFDTSSFKKEPAEEIKSDHGTAENLKMVVIMIWMIMMVMFSKEEEEKMQMKMAVITLMIKIYQKKN